MTHGEEFWEAERILDEKMENGVSYFLIKWLGEDLKGIPWKPTWEPEENCTVALIKEWEVTKGGRKVEGFRSSERRSSVSSYDTLSEDGDSGVVGVVGDDQYSSETSTIIDEDEGESPNDAGMTPNENPNATTTTSSILSAVASFIGISTSQKRPQSESAGSEQINEAKKIRIKESLDDGESDDFFDKNSVSVAQQSLQVQTQTNVLQRNPSLQVGNDDVISNTSNVSVRNTRNNNSPYVYPDASGLINEIRGKNNVITYLLQEKEYFQRKLKQYEKNRRFHQSKNQALTKELIQSRKLLQEKQIEYTRIYKKLEQVLEELNRTREQCNKKDVKMRSTEIELEGLKRQFDAKYRKDQKQITLLEKVNNNLTAENKKLLEEKKETLKVFDTSISSDFAHLGQTTRSSGNVQALRVENERLTSQINNLNLQCSLQRQNLVVLEEKVVEQESLIRLLMDIQKISYQGDPRAEELKRSFSRRINLPLPNAPPVYARPPNSVTPLPPPLEFIPWNGMPLKN